MTELPLLEDYAALFLQQRPLIDLRAPCEFAEGAFPTAINLPLMSDSERAAVGTCYKQQGQQAAIALGHQLVRGDVREQRLQGWLTQISQHPETVIYCFRGGLRSQTVQQWLAERGCVVPRVAGGYKALRQFLLQTLERITTHSPLWLVTGMTGSGKTDLLARVPAAIDLEAHANHRGSSFGGLPQGQPSNINFENGLAIELLQRERRGQTHLVMEDESRMIGRCTLPLPLFSTMERAPLILLEAPLAERVARIRRQYVDELLAQFVRQLGDEQAARQALSDFLQQAMAKLERRLGGDRYRLLRGELLDALAAQFDHADGSGHRLWIERLLSDYYDPLYQRSLRANSERIVFRGEADACLAYLQQLQFCPSTKASH
ncbi:MAG: tRNA 2-selenouridine(34) synthase MnmH [Aeromonadaceae bacterium]